MSVPIIISTACPYPQPHERGRKAFIEAVRRHVREEEEWFARHRAHLDRVFSDTERAEFDLTDLTRPKEEP